jgi:hypothetical protein
VLAEKGLLHGTSIIQYDCNAAVTPNITVNHPVGKGQLKGKEQIRITNLFPLKKSSKPECRSDLRIYNIFPTPEASFAYNILPVYAYEKFC